MNNTPFAQLAELAPSATAPGLSPADALAGFHNVLRGEAIPAGRLMFAGYPSAAAVNGCSLVCDSSVLGLQPHVALLQLSGAGPGYSGLLNECAKDLPQSVLESVKGQSIEVAPLGRRVGLCIRLLDSPVGTLAPSVHLTIQRHLSSILLDNPSLLHPAFLVPRRNGNRTEFVSIASALASSTQGALPRYSHFRPDETPPVAAGDIRDRHLFARLEAFARSPCVRWALSERTMRIEAADPVGSSCAIQVKQEALPQALLRSLTPHPEFLASVLELDELAFPRLRSEKALPFAHAIAAQDRWRHQLVPLLARSTFAAFGSLHSHLEGINGWTPFHRKDRWLLAAVKARAPELAGLMAKTLGAGLQRWMFPPGASAIPPRLAAENLERIVAGLVECGLAESSLSAAAFVMEHTIGRSRPDGRLPSASTPQALAFLSGLDRYGAGPAAMTQLCTALGSAAASAHAADWQAAVDAIEIERRMGALLNAPVAAASPVAPRQPARARTP